MAADASVLHFRIGSMKMLDGYTSLPAGKLVNVVTYLEMRTPPDGHAPATAEFDIRRVTQPDLNWYRALYRRIGEPWLWFSRLRMSDTELSEILNHLATDIFVLSRDGEECGLLEFDRSKMPDIEITFFGITPEMIGKGAGRALLAHCLPLAWGHKPQCVWLHTCTSDHPSALAFYQKMGFVPYKRAIEIADDPRLTGDIPRTAAPHVPIL